MGIAAFNGSESWISTLFAPARVVEREEKGVCSHWGSYLETTEGVQATFELLARCFEVIKINKTPLTELGALAERVQSVFENSAEALDLPNLISKPYLLSLDLWSCYQPSLGAAPIMRRMKDVVIDCMLVIRAVTKTVLLANATQVYLLAARPLFQFSLAAVLSTVFADVSDLIRDYVVLMQDNHTDETALLALVNVIKNLASVIIGTLLASHILLEATALSSALVLGCGFIFSAARISSYFINKMMVEPVTHLPS